MNRSPCDIPADALPPTAPAPPPACSRCCGMRASTVVFVIVLSVTFGSLSHARLWHTDLWGHLQYGEIICTEHAIPLTEPTMPLASEVPFVDTAWLSQVIAYQVFRLCGLAGLQILYAASITACFASLLWIARRRRRDAAICLAAAALMAALQWEQLPIARPQLAGGVCFMALLACLSRRRYSASEFLFVTVLMMLWANLHGSFVMGLGMLAGLTVGRAADVVRRGKRCVAPVHDRKTRRLLMLTFCGSVAVLVNPYGARLYEHVLTISQNPNLADLIEWQMLSLNSVQGRVFAVTAMLLPPILYWSPRRVWTAEVLLLVALGAATVWTSRMIVWFAPIAGYLLALHGGALWNRFLKRRGFVRPSDRPHWAWTLLAATAIVAAAAYSPLGYPALTGQQADLASSVSRQTPVAAAEYLAGRPMPGPIFNTYEWGDYLSWVGRRHGQRWPIFVASHAHLVPRQVWVDYMAVIGAPADWEQRLARYGIKAVVIDQQHRRALIARLRASRRWTLVFEDDVAAIYVRKQ